MNIIYAFRPFDRVNILVKETVEDLTTWLDENEIAYRLLGGYFIRKNVALALASPSPLTIIIGHGRASSYVGSSLIGLYHDGFGAITSLNDSVLGKSDIVVAMSCYTLNELGKKAIESGTKAFIGWKSRLLGNIQDLDQDEVIDVIDTLTVIPKCLLMGYTIKESVDMFKEACDYYINICKNSDMCETEYYKVMQHNKECVGYLGDDNIKLEALA